MKFVIEFRSIYFIDTISYKTEPEKRVSFVKGPLYLKRVMKKIKQYVVYFIDKLILLKKSFFEKFKLNR